MNQSHQDSEARIVVQDGVTYVHGEIPITKFSELALSQAEGTVMDQHVARLAGATLAFGMPEALKRARTDLETRARGNADQLITESGLSNGAIQWLAVGEHGASSEAIFYHLTGVAPSQRTAGDFDAHPHDPADLRRCRLLLEQAPDLAQRLGEMAKVSETWARLIEIWDDLCATMDQECPDWRDGQGRARETYRMLRQAREVAQYSAPNPGM